MPHPAWLLIVVGVVIVVIGVAWLFTASLPGLGRLPGDIVIKRDNFRFVGVMQIGDESDPQPLPILGGNSDAASTVPAAASNSVTF